MGTLRGIDALYRYQTTCTRVDSTEYSLDCESPCDSPMRDENDRAAPYPHS